ncbi:MAG: methionine--tRNA ligase [Flavobacteriales bacterium]|jgi:methionyl-tRNA synthetase|tara:strand:- start:253 stop:2295 length:2043 start_codon:yes stop_codon:yes gene_type:complete
MSQFNRTTVTAALPYANGPIHIGHLAGCYLPSDIYVRFLRLRGEDVAFICGSDEHGMAITMRARKEGVSPKDIVDRYHVMMRDALKDFGVDFDVYSRTSGDKHKEVASSFFKELYDKGVFDTRETDQYYDPEAKQFLADRYIKGTCPRCSYPEAYGDQCESCGATLNPTDLINPASTLSGATLERRKTTNWFLPLDKLAPDLRAYIESHPEWKANVYGQCKSWLDSGDGLQPRSMTRDLDWGVPVPVEGAEGKVLYVWFDAPLGYITATQELFGKDWEKWWKADDTRLIHFIGKDNIVFHCIIFPAILMQHGEYILADQVPANEFLNLEGDKLSTSRDWAVWLHEYLEDFPGKADVLRYALCATMPENKDNDFTWADFQQRNNSELVSIYGNLVNRIMVLNHKFCDGKVPVVGQEPADLEVLKNIAKQADAVAKSLEQFKFRDALTEAMNLARVGNKYLADQAPWKVMKTDLARAQAILGVSTQIAAALTVVMDPFMPQVSDKLRVMLGMTSALQWSDLGSEGHLIKVGTQLGQAALLFDKIEDEAMDIQRAKLVKPKPVPTYPEHLEPMLDSITFDQFAPLDIRVATVTAAEAVPKADRLLKLTLDTGLDTRTVLSGIAEHFSPEEVVGKEVCVLVNLAPRKIRGIESQGMVLMAEDAKSGKLRFVSPSESVAPGSKVS